MKLEGTCLECLLFAAFCKTADQSQMELVSVHYSSAVDSTSNSTGVSSLFNQQSAVFSLNQRRTSSDCSLQKSPTSLFLQLDFSEPLLGKD